MGKQFSTLLSTALVAALCGTASAYTLNGTVTGKDGKAIQGADVKLLKRNKSTTTDEQGKFTFQEETIGLTQARSAGGFSVTNGVLNFTQNGNTPVQVKIFDMVGNQVFAQTFQGSGSVDLNSVIEAQGTYLARVKLGSAQETIRFNASGSFSGSAMQKHQALARLSNEQDTLRVTFEGYDTLKTYLPNLDTTVSIKLNEVSSEPTFKFGYDAVWTREQSRSTGIGCGLAVPHAKIDCVDRMCMAAATIEGGLDFASFDGEPVYLIILIVSPGNTVGPHLKALSSIFADHLYRQHGH